MIFVDFQHKGHGKIIQDIISKNQEPLHFFKFFLPLNVWKYYRLGKLSFMRVNFMRPLTCSVLRVWLKRKKVNLILKKKGSFFVKSAVYYNVKS